ncbi:galactokinase [Paenibacillus sp. P96]|uniref:Galactokinase n=1 Tax=Paenibacillus zeirhizosphaerae TaxID=2987519 RepID=A0ABT9FR00_9BACL|nr:galactokinase family protein [Paenibacillus sp. P96]MDP4097155.1 galactokinase [Paenibacillus sp. P96]
METIRHMNKIQTPSWQKLLVELYGPHQLAVQTDRYQQLLAGYREHYGEGDALSLFSSPGRTEIGGNHTDHNHGKVLAASIDLDTIAAAFPTEDSVISIVSEGYPDQYRIDLSDLEPKPEESGTLALIRGIAAGFVDKGFKIGGFNAYVSSNVLSASGLSSSASFEMLICTIMNTFYNEGSLDTVMMAKIGQYAENQFWNKPSGLLGQMACAYGGLITIDFENPEQPVIEPVKTQFRNKGYSLVIVSTGGNHADLTEDYAAVPGEMKAVARALDGEVVRDLTVEQIYSNLGTLRQQVGDRAVLRALHFLEENERVEQEVAALQTGRLEDFLQLVTASGNSSWKWLQNVYRESEVKEQGIAIALALTEIYLRRIGTGACRVHGGGFAGVILAILPEEHAEDYTAYIKRALATPVFNIQIREQGAVCLNDMVNG